MRQVVEAPHHGVIVPLGSAVTCPNKSHIRKCTGVARCRWRKNHRLLTFNCVPEAFRGGGVVGRRVKSVHLQTVCHILGLWETLDHRPVDISCWVPSNWGGLGAWNEVRTETLALLSALNV